MSKDRGKKVIPRLLKASCTNSCSTTAHTSRLVYPAPLFLPFFPPFLSKLSSHGEDAKAQLHTQPKPSQLRTAQTPSRLRFPPFGLLSKLAANFAPRERSLSVLAGGGAAGCGQPQLTARQQTSPPAPQTHPT